MAQNRQFKFFLFLAVVGVLSSMKMVEVRAENLQQQQLTVNDEARVNEYRCLLKNYISMLRGEQFINWNDDDRVQVTRLAAKLRDFKKEIKNDKIAPEGLDDYVCDRIEKEAGSFKVVSKEELKKLSGQEGQKVLWQSFARNVADCFKKGQFKISKSYNNEMRGKRNWFNYSSNYASLPLNSGGRNYRGGLILQCENFGYNDLWCDYRCCESGDFTDVEEAKKLEAYVPAGFEVLGFAVDLKSSKQIELEDVERYSYLLMYEYPEEFGFIDEILKLKPIIQKNMRIEEKQKQKKPSHHGCCCWHDWRLIDFFDYVKQIENQTQRELFGESLFDLDVSTLNESEDEIKGRARELKDKIETLEYSDKFRENLIKAGKKQHITNENYYLLNNYALIAKLLGYDIIKHPKKGSRAELYEGDFIVFNAGVVSVCEERFKTEGETHQFRKEQE